MEINNRSQHSFLNTQNKSKICIFSPSAMVKKSPKEKFSKLANKQTKLFSSPKYKIG